MRELALLQHIYARSTGLGERVIVGPGDDMAVLRLGGETLLIAVDQVADGVHFDSRCTSLERIGRKAVVRNLSDIAAMAASPVAAVASVMLPRTMDQPQGEALFEAMRQTGERHGCALVGGDVGVWGHPLQISVTVLAEPAGVEPVLRSGAKAGDAVFVSGELGNAWSPGGGSPGDADGGGAEPEEPVRIELARGLGRLLGGDLHSMIDLSDGLASDLERICERSEVGAVVEVARLPLRVPRRPRPELGEAWEAALYDGEDYELCFTVAADAAERVPATLLDVPLHRIGTITPPGAGSGGADGAVRLQLKLPDGRLARPRATGWEHRS